MCTKLFKTSILANMNILTVSQTQKRSDFRSNSSVRRGNRARICKRLWSPGIDSEESISPAYVACRAGTTVRVVVQASQPENRFSGSIKGIQIRAQSSYLYGTGQDDVRANKSHDAGTVAQDPGSAALHTPDKRYVFATM
jgi:hypothetical protein